MRYLFKSALSLAFAVLCAATGAVNYDGIEYKTIMNDEGEPTTTFEVAKLPNGAKYKGDIVIPDTVLVGETLYTVVRIAKDAMQSNLITSVVIPNTVEVIDSSAFSGCTSMKSIDLGKGVKRIECDAFRRCDSVTSITLPASLEFVGDRAFYCWAANNTGSYTWCTGDMRSVIIEDSPNPLYFDGVSSIIRDSLRYVYVGRNITGLQKFGSAKLEKVVFSNYVTSIPNDFLASSYILKDLTLSDSLKYIGKEAFSVCSSLTSVKIPDNVEIIDTSAFYCCANLTNLDLGKGVRIIKDNAFNGCNIDTLRIPANVESIDHCFRAKTHSFTGNTGAGSDWRSEGKNLCHLIIEDSENPLYIGSDDNFRLDSLVSIYLGRALVGGNQMFSWARNLRKLAFGPAIKSVPKKLFSHCDSLVTLKLGENIEYIGYQAFQECYSLDSLVIPNSVTVIDTGAFESNYALRYLELGKGVKNINRDAFWNCYALENLVIPSNVEYIGNAAFRCKSKGVLSNLTIEDSSDTLYLGSDIFSRDNIRDMYIGRQLDGDQTFQYVKTLRTLEFGNHVKSIGNEFAYNCDSLETLILGDSIEIIGKSAFNGSGIESLVLPSTIKVIRADAFNGCKNLSELFIGANIDTIEGGAFEGAGIKRLTIEDSDVELKYPKTGWYSNPFNTKYLEYLYYGRPLSDTTIFKVKSSKLKTIEFGPAVTLIPESFAEWCDSLRTIKFGGNEKYIGKSAFYNCNSLEEVKLPNSVILLGKNAFNSCSALKRLVLSDSLKKIDDGAFWGCAAIDGELVIPASVDTIVSGAFGGTYGRTIAVKRLIFEDSERPIAVKSNSFGFSRLESIYDGRRFDGDFTVRGVDSLKSLSFGAGIDSIPNSFATGCPNIKSVTSNAMVPPVLGEYFVDEKVYKTAELTVPDTAVAAYKEARLWKEFYKINGEDVSVSLVGADMPVVYAVGNTIVIPSAKACDKIMVCDFSGVVLYYGSDNMISINGNGVYIVVVNGVGQKVMVK